MKTESDFKTYYDQTLVPDLKELEIKRLRIANRARTLIIVELIIFIAIIIYSLFFRPERPNSPGPDFGLIFLIAGSLIVLLIIFGFALVGFYKGFRVLYKKNIISKLVNQISDELDYSPNDNIQVHDFKASRIFKGEIARYQGRDLVTGTLKGIPFRFSWLNVYMRTIPDERSKSSMHKLFAGIFYIADFKRAFKADAVVFPNLSKVLRIGTLARLIQDALMGKRIDLGDEEFRKEYAVYSEEPDKAQGMITPGLMQWILDFKKITNGRVFVSFAANKLYIGVYMKRNLFEPPLFRKTENYDFVWRNFRYLLLFSGLVEDMAKRI
ncbi:MAG: DUF3137 domain-containing protein [Bacteroidales bacterium]|nr:DUF3137 domain-containing protein [Bacteroidales bacterium]